MSILKAFKNIISYTVEKRFFVSIIRSDDSREILADAEVETGKEIYIHRPIVVRKDVVIEGGLKLGRRKQSIFDKNDKILHSALSQESSCTGQILGFNADLCTTTYPKDFIFLSPLFPKSVMFGDVNFLVEEFEPRTIYKNWNFVLPSTVLINRVNLQFYFLNTENEVGNASFRYSLNTIDSEDVKDNNLTMKINKGIIISDPLTTNIITRENNFSAKNSLCSLKFGRYKGIGSSDTIVNPLYLIGIKIEFENNFFSK